MKISVFFVAAAIAYGSSFALAVPIQPTHEITKHEPIHAREVSDALVEAREIETGDIFEREPRGGGGYHHRREFDDESYLDAREPRGGSGYHHRREFDDESNLDAREPRGGGYHHRREFDDESNLDAREPRGGSGYHHRREFDDEFDLDAREFEDEEEIFGRAPVRVSYHWYSE